MKPKLEKIPTLASSSISVKREISPYLDYPWHYHPEYEICFYEKSYGIRLVGNHIGNFSDGEIVFISPNLPHVWRNDQIFYKGYNHLFVDVYVIFFKDDSLGKGFFQLPEFSNIRKLFELGKQGFLVKKQGHKEISELIKLVYNSSNVERLIYFLRILEKLARLDEFELLSSPSFNNTVSNTDADRINKVMEYLMKNYMSKVNLEEAAQLVSMNKSSFCRYFKLITHKTFSKFLNEIRIGHACRLLSTRNMTTYAICFEVGYNNISYFNKQFKKITGLTAKDYKKKYLNCAINI